MKNWKTSAGGILVALVIAIKVLKGGELNVEDYALLAACGTFMFTKDHDVTGGKKKQ
jgi:hypothetical protein